MCVDALVPLPHTTSGKAPAARDAGWLGWWMHRGVGPDRRELVVWKELGHMSSAPGFTWEVSLRGADK